MNLFLDKHVQLPPIKLIYEFFYSSLFNKIINIVNLRRDFVFFKLIKQMNFDQQDVNSVSKKLSRLTIKPLEFVYF